MANYRKIVSGSVALFLISISGCAGNGLKSMFSSNETEGYRTLEELEAEEAEAAKRNADVADTDSDSPRFAPWLPFGKKSAEDPAAAASSEPVLADSEEPTTAFGWWKNPFRGGADEAVEKDPFLAQDNSQSDEEARDEKNVEPAGLPVATNDDVEFSLAEEFVERAGSNREADALPGEDDQLVEKFATHFKQDTVETAEAAEQAESLIVAGKTTAKHSLKSESDSEDKLRELELLLAEKRSSHRNAAAKAASFADESSADTESPGENFESSTNTVAAIRQQAGASRNRDNKAVDSFDSFLAGTPSPTVSPKKISTLSDRDQSERTGTDASTDVTVAAADWLFGDAANSTSAKVNRPSLSRTASGGWSGTVSDNVHPSLQTENGRLSADSEQAQRMFDSATDQFAMSIASVRGGESVPAAALKDTPDTTFPFHEGSYSQTAGKNAFRSGNLMHRSSASREVPPSPASGSLTDDSFFADVPSALASNGLATAVPGNSELTGYQDSAADPGSPSSMKGRNWLLLLGGVIVVLLLFAPGRKKPLQANHA